MPPIEYRENLSGHNVREFETTANINGVRVYETSFILLTGNRYLAVTACMWIQEMAQILDDEFRPLGELIRGLGDCSGITTKE